ncbi:MAG TPA: D-alanyl-D-alanine carboxypeptidase/D-alanyl-D-alanine-endopeptidase [Vicinamibacteria bacterium]|nr:D-alanyl-D-alanine carboxypeptidase/D-alanyl-D-alanine-endopeptidase [Vicinamibacteria bacterium]
MRRVLAVAAMVALVGRPAGAKEPSPSELKRRIEPLTARSALAGAWWGIEVRSLRSGKVLYALNATRNFMPASTMKLITTAAVLDALGPTERLRTTVETAGRLDGFGRILGDVYLVGRGDTSLSARFGGARPTAALEELADRLQAAGVRRIEGRLIGHEGYFAGPRRGERWGWADLVWCYGTEVSALVFNDNCAQLTAAPGERVGDPARVDAAPASRYYRIASSSRTSAAAAPEQMVLVRDLGTMEFRLGGTVPLGAPAWSGSVAMEDPARFAATVFAEVLQARGIPVSGGVDTGAAPLPAGARVLAVHESPPLAELLAAINKPSQNLHAEMMLRVLGARVKGRGGAEEGLHALDDFLRRSRVSTASWNLEDGSGLSRTGLVTPQGMVDLLVAMDRHPHRTAFIDSLPVAGVDGTLANRMKGGAAEGRVRAKTGTLTQVNALAGYATTRAGDRLAFCIVLNHHTAGSSAGVGAVDEIVAALVGR